MNQKQKDGIERFIEERSNVASAGSETKGRRKRIFAWIKEHVRIGWKQIWFTFKW